MIELRKFEDQRNMTLTLDRALTIAQAQNPGCTLRPELKESIVAALKSCLVSTAPELYPDASLDVAIRAAIGASLRKLRAEARTDKSEDRYSFDHESRMLARVDGTAIPLPQFIALGFAQTRNVTLSALLEVNADFLAEMLDVRVQYKQGATASLSGRNLNTELSTLDLLLLVEYIRAKYANIFGAPMGQVQGTPTLDNRKVADILSAINVEKYIVLVAGALINPSYHETTYGFQTVLEHQYMYGTDK